MQEKFSSFCGWSFYLNRSSFLQPTIVAVVTNIRRLLTFFSFFFLFHNRIFGFSIFKKKRFKTVLTLFYFLKNNSYLIQFHIYLFGNHQGLVCAQQHGRWRRPSEKSSNILAEHRYTTLVNKFGSFRARQHEA